MITGLPGLCAVVPAGIKVPRSIYIDTNKERVSSPGTGEGKTRSPAAERTLSSSALPATRGGKNSPSKLL